MTHQMSSPLLHSPLYILYIAPLSPDTGLSRGGVIKVHHGSMFIIDHASKRQTRISRQVTREEE